MIFSDETQTPSSHLACFQPLISGYELIIDCKIIQNIRDLHIVQIMHENERLFSAKIKKIIEMHG